MADLSDVEPPSKRRLDMRAVRDTLKSAGLDSSDSDEGPPGAGSVADGPAHGADLLPEDDMAIQPDLNKTRKGTTVDDNKKRPGSKKRKREPDCQLVSPQMRAWK